MGFRAQDREPSWLRGKCPPNVATGSEVLLTLELFFFFGPFPLLFRLSQSQPPGQNQQARFTFGDWIDEEVNEDGESDAAISESQEGKGESGDGATGTKDDSKDAVVSESVEFGASTVQIDGKGKADGGVNDEESKKSKEEGEMSDEEKEKNKLEREVGDKKKKVKTESMRELLAEEPRLYSKRTQKGVNSWHVPLEGSREWLCVRWLRRQEN